MDRETPTERIGRPASTVRITGPANDVTERVATQALGRVRSARAHPAGQGDYLTQDELEPLYVKPAVSPTTLRLLATLAALFLVLGISIELAILAAMLELL